MKTYIWEGNYLIPGIELQESDLDSVPQSGPADYSIEGLLEVPRISLAIDALDPAKIANELRQYGAWDDEELQDHPQNRARLLWIAICDCKERPEDFIA